MAVGSDVEQEQIQVGESLLREAEAYMRKRNPPIKGEEVRILVTIIEGRARARVLNPPYA